MSATFAVSALAVASIPAGAAFRPGRSAADRQSLLSDVVLGVRALRTHPVAMRLVGADIVAKQAPDDFVVHRQRTLRENGIT